jgi:hypothetical protein
MVNISGKRDRIKGTLWASIQARRVIEFYYHGGYRTVEPFALGIVRYGNADNESLLCYQIGGYSDLNEAVGWKLYRASEMEDISVSREQFSGDRPGYDPDKIDMVKIYCCVTPVKKTVEEVKVLPKEEPKVEATPLPDYELLHKPVIKSLNHNELMRRFRVTHPVLIPEMNTKTLPNPLAKPLSESAGLKSAPLAQLIAQFLLAGQTA